jgi:hypothetical protein
MAKHPSHILEMARKGAEHRYEELKSEIATLVAHFPHLRGTKESVGKAGRVTPGKELASEPTPIRKRSTMSAAAKKAVSLRMKKYWAARRAAKK